MASDGLPEEWDILASWLPSDLDALAREHGFMRRARGLQDSSRWLRLILMHVGGGLSLKQTVARASELELAKVSSVALFKRLRTAETWLQALTAYLLAEQRQKLGIWAARWPGGIRVVDATDVVEPGTTGSTWRIHYSIRLPEMVCDHYELTDSSGGEKLGRFSFKAKELVLADRGYSHRAGVAHVLECGADVVVRWNPVPFPLLDLDGKAFAVLSRVQGLKVGQEMEWPVDFIHGNRTYRLRLCARRKGRLASERAQCKAKRKSQKNGTTIDPSTLEMAKYVFVLTSTEASTLPTRAVLGVYRSRWQIELVFKRLKSLLGMGHVPKIDDASAKAWMQAKILTSLLIERTLIEARLFSPWGDPR